MKAREIIVLLLVICFCLIFVLNAVAQEQKYEIQSSDTVKIVLEKHAGKEVILRLNSGGEIQGIVTKVGDNVVHISKISTMSYYDAAVRIDNIAAVLIKVRTK